MTLFRILTNSLPLSLPLTVASVFPWVQIYHAEAGPVEEFYRAQGILLDFEIVAGIPETLPGLVATLKANSGADIFVREATA